MKLLFIGKLRTFLLAIAILAIQNLAAQPAPTYARAFDIAWQSSANNDAQKLVLPGKLIKDKQNQIDPNKFLSQEINRHINIFTEKIVTESDYKRNQKKVSQLLDETLEANDQEFAAKKSTFGKLFSNNENLFKKMDYKDRLLDGQFDTRNVLLAQQEQNRIAQEIQNTVINVQTTPNITTPPVVATPSPSISQPQVPSTPATTTTPTPTTPTTPPAASTQPTVYPVTIINNSNSTPPSTE